MAGMNPVRLQQLMGWVTSALDQSPATPETWLQTVCTDDAALAEAQTLTRAAAYAGALIEQFGDRDAETQSDTHHPAANGNQRQK